MMLTNSSHKKYIESKYKYLNLFLLILIQIKSIFCVIEDSCLKVYSFNNTTCFNDKIKFYDKFRGGHFETFINGTLIIEYSSDSNFTQRLFYAIKKNGRYYFPNESPFKFFEAKNPLNNGYNGRFESKNKIIYLSGDIYKTKEYLFSTSNHYTVTELHDIENGISYYWDTISFWEIIGIYSYEIIILDLPEENENHYLCVFTQFEEDLISLNGAQNVYSKTFSLRKFKFDSINNYTIIGKLDYTDNYNCRIISAFVVYDWNVIVIFFLKKTDNQFQNAIYSISFYNYNLSFHNEINKENIESPNSGDGVFFRSFLIKDRLAAFLYFLEKYGKYFKLEVGELTGSEGNYNFNMRLDFTISEEYYSPHIRFNDFFKIDDKRLVFITSKYPYDQMNFFLIDLLNNYYNY